MEIKADIGAAAWGIGKALENKENKLRCVIRFQTERINQGVKAIGL